MVMLLSEENRDMYGIDDAQSLESLKEPGNVLGILQREIEVHKTLKHPNIAGLYGLIMDQVHGVEFPMW